MTLPITRDQFVQTARRVPKDLYGVITAVGYLLFFLGVGALIHGWTVSFDPDAFRIDWRIAAASMLTGGALMATSSALVNRRFRLSARAAGYSPDQIREIEAEAQRLNAEEDT